MPILKERKLTDRRDHGDQDLKLLAATFAVAANLLFGLYIMRTMSKQLPVTNASAGRTPIVWISFALPIARQTAPSRPFRVGTADRRTSKEPQSLRMSRVRLQHAVNNFAEATFTIDEWSQSKRSAAEKPDLSLKPMDIDFSQRFTRRSVGPMEPTPLRMKLQFADRTWGGRLHSMTKDAICRELFKSLRTSPESAAAIMRSMRENDCQG